jgi:uncharacterized peroxidase-related enzyme
MSYLREESLDETNFPLFAAVKSRFGFIPNLLRAQTMRPDLLEAQSKLAGTILFNDGALSRKDKEYLFLVCSGANLSTYCVTAHCEIVRMLGIEGPEPEQIAIDYAATDLPMRTKALLGFALKLTNTPTRISEADIDALRTFGYTDEAILEAVTLVAYAKFANFMAFGLGTLPDFDSSKIVFDRTHTATAGTVRF